MTLVDLLTNPAILGPICGVAGGAITAGVTVYRERAKHRSEERIVARADEVQDRESDVMRGLVAELRAELSANHERALEMVQGQAEEVVKLHRETVTAIAGARAESDARYDKLVDRVDARTERLVSRVDATCSASTAAIAALEATLAKGRVR